MTLLITLTNKLQENNKTKRYHDRIGAGFQDVIEQQNDLRIRDLSLNWARQCDQSC